MGFVRREHPKMRQLGHRSWSVGTTKRGRVRGPWCATLVRDLDLLFLDAPPPDPRPWYRIILVCPWGALYLTTWRGRVQRWTPWSGYSQSRFDLVSWHPRYRGRST